MKTLYYFIFVSLILSTSNCSDEQGYELMMQSRLKSMNMSRPADSYTYPVRPGMKEWANFTSSKEMVDACQIPTKILENMSTQAVVQAIWEYPLLFEVISRSEYQRDFETMFFNNNAYLELTKRKDAGICLLERLDLIKLSTIDAVSLLKAFEVLSSQPVFLSQFNKDQKKKIIEITLRNDELIQKNKKMTSNPDRATAWLLIGRAMVAADYASFIEVVNKDKEFNYFLDGRYPALNGNNEYKSYYTYLGPRFEDVSKQIIQFGKDFLNGK